MFASRADTRMNAPRKAELPRPRRRWRRWLLALCAAPVVLLALLWLVAWIALPPERVVPMVLAQVGESLNLEISAEGDPASRLGDSPTFVVRNVVAREPGAATPLLRVDRVLVALPWRTLRSLGDTLELARVELDAPILDVPALRHWLATRPAGDTRVPTLADGLHVRNGRVDGDGWRVEALDLSLPRLQLSQPLRATLRGRYADTATQVPFDLAATLMCAASGSGVGVAGHATLQREDWRLPAWLTLSGTLHWNDGLQLLPLRFGASARYVSGDTAIPFVLGAYGPLRRHGDAWTLVPAGVTVRGGGLVPTFDARGRFALGDRLLLELDGRIAEWPAGWPALPPPLGQSKVPLSVSAAYAGVANLSDPLQLRVARDDPVSSTGQALRFDGRLRIPAIAGWAAAPTAQGSPLPPLEGRLEVPRMDVSGARLEGVTVEFEDDDAPAETATP